MHLKIRRMIAPYVRTISQRSGNDQLPDETNPTPTLLLPYPTQPNSTQHNATQRTETSLSVDVDRFCAVQVFSRTDG